MGMPKTGNEQLLFEGAPAGCSLNDFWRWGFSNLLDNTLRGRYSEFLVGKALNLDLSGGYENWTPWDLTFPYQWLSADGPRDEVRIEVKSSAYLQPYEQHKLSDIVFSIRPTRDWDANGSRSDAVKRQSDVYVFCLYSEVDRSLADPLILDKWKFYIILTKKLDEICGTQKTIALRSLQNLHPVQTDYTGIREGLIQCIHGG